MESKNAFLEKLQAEQAQKDLMSTADGLGKAQQAMTDAMILVLGYGESMGNDRWGEKRIMAFLEELRETYENMVFPGIEIRNDSDAYRATVDKMLKEKCPAAFIPWEQRYPFWTEETLEQEAAREKRARNRRRKGRRT